MKTYLAGAFYVFNSTMERNVKRLLILVLSVVISGALSVIPAAASKMDGKGSNNNTGSHPSAKRFERFQKTSH